MNYICLSDLYMQNCIYVQDFVVVIKNSDSFQ